MMTEKRSPWYADGYRLFLVLGLSTVVVLTVGTALYTEAIGDYDSRLPIFVGGGAVTAFMLALLGFWWVQLLGGARAEQREMEFLVSEQLPPLSALKSWTELYTQMALSGGRPAILKQDARRANRKILEWFAWANLLVLFPLANVWLYLLGVISQEGFMSYVPHVVVALCLLMLLRTYFLLGGRNGDYEPRMLEGLGLKASERRGKLKLFEGSRQGRRVLIESRGGQASTWVDQSTVEFHVASEQGKFAEAPRALKAALDLPKAQRWRGVQVRGGRDGIRVERDSSGQNMWLYDLWLAERIAEAVEK